MKNDLHRTFGQIFNNDITVFRDQLIEIQQYQADRSDSLQWAQRLRFLDISDVPNLAQLSKERNVRSTIYDSKGRRVQTPGARPILSIPIVEEDENDEEVPEYLAVSWKWVGLAERIPYGCGSRESFKYYIQRQPGSTPHISSFPDRYMDRVIEIAQSHGITKIWVDTECIYQRDGDEEKYPRDKELGVQVMDLVYADAKLAVGLLTTALMHQDEVDTLARLLDGDIFVNGDPKSKELKPDVDISKVQMLILRILSDPRWSRAWIFQEDHLSSYHMILAIPHSKHIHVNRIYNFGNVLGELQVHVARFRDCVTSFCLAQSDLRRWPSNEILRKAKRYKTFNTISLGAYPTTTYSVLVDICNRSIEKEHDRVAILANALKFSTRLDVSNTSNLVKLDKYSLSTILFALILMNGEILHNSNNILAHTVQSYIELGEYRIRAPHPRKEQSFIDHCRFRSPAITHRGIETQGWVFRLFRSHSDRMSCITFSPNVLKAISQLYEDETSQMREPRSILNDVQQKVVEIIISQLESKWPKCRLANFMQRNLNLDRNPPPRNQENPAKVTMLKMMVAVVRALKDGHEVRLAHLHSSPRNSPPSAMFISPGGWSTRDSNNPALPIYVFVSWDNPPNAPRQERLASLEVAAIDQEKWIRNGCRLTEGTLLESGGWINGVWDARGEGLETYVFSWLDNTEKAEPHGTKRKRHAGGDEINENVTSDDDRHE